MKLDGIEGRVALVTGGSRGIGRCIAETLRDQGARVASGDIDTEAIDGVLAVSLDVSSEPSVDEAFTRIEAELGPVELLVLNAGILSKASLEDTTSEDWRRTLEVNLTGPFLCARRAVSRMREAGYGRIVAIGSSAGITGAGAAPPALSAYAASKAGVMALAKSIALEYAAYGITANALAPTLIDTGMLASVPDDFRRVIPVGRYGRPEEIAALTAFLCSGHAGYITGEIVDINGGFLVD
jgi:NAD(P)-dependent dehydrogenase (short-subunit alcohol dehydrogenase family)